jgi:hypothetical protein
MYIHQQFLFQWVNRFSNAFESPMWEAMLSELQLLRFIPVLCLVAVWSIIKFCRQLTEFMKPVHLQTKRQKSKEGKTEEIFVNFIIGYA